MKVAIVHDWLTNLGGAERVVMSLKQAYPEADIFTSVYNPDKLPEFKNFNIKTSFLQNWPLAKTKHQLFPTLRRLAFESFDFSGYDVVISSSSAEAKGVITPTETLHLSYIHTPTRYYWSGYKNYLKNPGYGFLNPLIRLVMPRQVKKMRHWDYAASQRPDLLVANSKTVQRRIAKYYNRGSTVVYPPVDLSRFNLKKSTDEGFFLAVSRLIPYKRVDLAVEACSRLNKKLVVVGTGSELPNLKRGAGPSIDFVGALEDRAVAKLYQSCQAFIFCAEEDFGITPLEAMACGKPVIAYGKGGALETVLDGQTGLFFESQTADSLAAALEQFEASKFKPKKIVEQAAKFSEDRFASEIKKNIEGEIEKRQKKN